jgi:hypothetical protein
MKKALAIFLSIYILTLTAIPCMDRPECHEMQESTLEQTSDSEHHCENDHCSPFCTCNCCTSPIVVQLAHLQLSVNTITQKQSTPYFLEQTPSMPTSVWQPPKIS